MVFLDHYFTDKRNLEENRKDHSFRFSGHLFTFTTDKGVFSKTDIDRGTQVFLEVLSHEDLSGKLLDLGCGYGVLGIVLKYIFPKLQIQLTDINPRAVELTNLNCQKNQIEGVAYESNGFENVKDTFDIIVTNPPIRAGKTVIYKMFEDASGYLAENGILYVVIRKKQGAESAVKKLIEVFDNCEVVEKNKGYWVLKSHKNSN